MAAFPMDGLTAAIVDTASALSAVRLQSEMSVKLLDKALDQQGQMAMSLLQSLPAGTGQVIDILA